MHTGICPVTYNMTPLNALVNVKTHSKARKLYDAPPTSQKHVFLANKREQEQSCPSFAFL